MLDSFLTTIDELNREILLRIADDDALINICKTNKYAADI